MLRHPSLCCEPVLFRIHPFFTFLVFLDQSQVLPLVPSRSGIYHFQETPPPTHRPQGDVCRGWSSGRGNTLLICLWHWPSKNLWWFAHLLRVSVVDSVYSSPGFSTMATHQFLTQMLYLDGVRLPPYSLWYISGGPPWPSIAKA